MTVLRWPSHHPEAERSLIGAAILNAEAYDAAAISADLFYDSRCREVWGVLGAMRATGRPFEVVAIEAELGAERARAVGGMGFLSECLEHATITMEVALEHAKIVREDWVTRETVLALSDLIAKARADDLRGNELLQAAFGAMQRLLDRNEAKVLTMGQAVEATVHELMRLSQAKERGESISYGLATGYTDLDSILGGIPMSVVTVIAARPSMGKSSLLRGIADHITHPQSGHGGMYFTAEDTAQMLAMRTLSDHARVNLERLRALDLTRGDMDGLFIATNNLRERKAWLIDDRSGITVEEIGLTIRRHKRRLNLKAVFVDYIQIVLAPPKKGFRQATGEEDLRAKMDFLADLAKQEGVAIVINSQLNRELEKRENKRPMMADLRGSGAIEERADVVIGLYRDEVYNDETEDRGIVEAIILKNKHGRTGTVELAWDAERASVRNLARRS